MKHNRVRRTALLALAVAFLAAAWVWDGLASVARRIVAVVPWTRFKRVFVLIVDRLPAPLVLLIFLVPLLIVEPLLFVATIAVAMGYVVSGTIAWIVLKLLAISVIPAIFDLTKHRLMTIRWFVWAFDKVMAFHHYASKIVAPYKQQAQALIRRGRQLVASLTSRAPGIAHIAARAAARRRAANGRPTSPQNG